MFYIISTVGLTYILIICNCIYIHTETAIYSVNEKANLHINLKKLIFDKYLFGSILNISKNPIDKS